MQTNPALTLQSIHFSVILCISLLCGGWNIYNFFFFLNFTCKYRNIKDCKKSYCWKTVTFNVSQWSMVFINTSMLIVSFCSLSPIKLQIVDKQQKSFLISAWKILALIFSLKGTATNIYGSYTCMGRWSW